MTALVPELVDMASNHTVSTADLLRRALVVARRLDSLELVEWISAELNGYTKEIPDYRIINGQLLVHNPINGLIPFLVGNSKQADVLSRHPERQSIPELEILAKSDGDLVRYFPRDLEQRLMRGMSVPMRPLLSFSAVQVQGIIEKVRNRVLEWALDLERRGVLGEGMTFTQKEKEIVQEQHYHFGNVSGSQIQISSTGSTQTQTNNTGTSLEDLQSLISALSSLINHRKMDHSAKEELRADLATLQAQASSPKPKWEIIKATTRSIKAIAEGTAGNILSELAKPHLATLLALAAS